MESYQLQIQIGEYISNLVQQLDQKMNTISEQINNIEGNIENISSRLSKIENVNMTLMLNINSCINSNINSTINKKHDNSEFDPDTKRKISIAKKERDYQRLLEKEREQWEKEYQQQDLLLARAREEWEKERHKKNMELNNNPYSYIS